MNQNESYDVLTREEKKLLKVLKNKRNVDGHYELLLSNAHISQYKKDPFFVYLDDPEFIDVLNAIYEQGDKKSFRKKIFRLIQQSIQEKMNSGIATYEFIQNVACIVDEKWLKQQIKTAPTRKMLTLYFFKKIENRYKNEKFRKGIQACPSKGELLDLLRRISRPELL